MKSLYERLGGDAAINAAVEDFYKRVLADQRISHFFEGVDMKRQAGHQKNFLMLAFGGPNRYTGRTLRNSHMPLVAKGLGDSHFDAVVENLAATLRGLGVEESLILEVAGVAESVRDEVLNRSPVGAA